MAMRSARALQLASCWCCAWRAGAQYLPPRPRTDPLAPTYASEHCAFYEVHPLRWYPAPLRDRAHARGPARVGRVRVSTRGNETVCDGYGSTALPRIACARCDDNPFRDARAWTVPQCASAPLVPVGAAAAGGGVARGAARGNVLLVTSDHNNHGLFAQVERALLQLHLAESNGLTPFVFLGRRVFAPPDACETGENQYFAPSRGDNVWEYYFEPVSSYRLGDAGRLLVADPGDARRHAIDQLGDTLTSYFEFQRYDAKLHATRGRVRKVGAALVRRWVRVRPELRLRAHALLSAWRRQSTHLLGVHLRGTDKAAHPKIPLERFVRHVDAYLAAHADALVVLATDDATYHAAFAQRYTSRLVSAGRGYATRNVVRDPKLPPAAKGDDAVVDALVLAHTDYLLKGTSSLSEFSIWYNPLLISAHLDLQIAGDAAESEAYRATVPTWSGGPFVPAHPSAETVDAMLRQLRAGTPVADTPPPAAAAASARAPTPIQPSGRHVARVPEWPEQQEYPRPLARPAAASAPAEAMESGGHRRRRWRRPAEAMAATKLADGAKCEGELRPMTRSECAHYASVNGLTHIGVSHDAKEYAGCALWEGKHVEFNEAGGAPSCNLGNKGQCLCVPRDADSWTGSRVSSRD